MVVFWHILLLLLCEESHLFSVVASVVPINRNNRLISN